MSAATLGTVLGGIGAIGGISALAAVLRIRPQNRVDYANADQVSAEANEVREKGPFERMAALADRYDEELAAARARIDALEQRAALAEAKSSEHEVAEAACQRELTAVKRRLSRMERGSR